MSDLVSFYHALIDVYILHIIVLVLYNHSFFSLFLSAQRIEEKIRDSRETQGLCRASKSIPQEGRDYTSKKNRKALVVGLNLLVTDIIYFAMYLILF